ncbi:MAG TPA: discoidin domain-containing protein [Pyrinomonadaceae bacterium]|nr:discoidin domain-containing protein [Pyrinomonadaceae bacterium]
MRQPVLALIATLILSAGTVSPSPKYRSKTKTQRSTPGMSLNLSGMWRFALDPSDSGVKERWFDRSLRDQIKLPGILQSQGFGDEISTNTPWVLSLYDRYWYLREDYKAYTKPGNIKVPFLSQPPRHYLGAAWYQREIQIPSQWVNSRAVLALERPHWETTVWVDGQRIGSDKSLVAPHVYELSSVSPGKHKLTIRVDNRMLMPYRPDAHSVSDSLGGSWNGIVGRIELTKTGRVWIDDVQVFPQLTKKSLLIKVRIGNVTGRPGTGTLAATGPGAVTVPVTWDEQRGSAEVELPLRADAPPWDEFQPRLLPLRLRLTAVGIDEQKELTVGLREFRAEGKEFVLNGRPIIFRGTHSGGDFPLTGYPPTDVPSWQKLFEICRRWGLNHMRFHSWSPPEAAFEAADQLGFYLQPEPGMWNEISPGTEMERMLYDETDRMIKAYGNHPSFMLLSASNEPKGRWQASLSKWVEHYRKEDPRRLYVSGTGHTEKEVPNITDGTDYLAIQRIGEKMLRREPGWFGADFGASLEGINVPVISHETGQWVAYPDYDVIKKFAGYMKPGNYEIFRDSMAAHGMLGKDKDFAQASGRFQLACYKEEIEANLRTPGLGGFQLLDLHDYLGQGTALVGLLDAFWEEKSYVSSDEFRQFCNTTVPLARLRSRVFTTAETFDVDVEVAHYGAKPIENAKAVWRITGTSLPTISLGGEWEARRIPIAKNIPLGMISADLSKLSPGEYKLTVTVAPASFFKRGTPQMAAGPGVVRGVTYFENEWNFWLFPQAHAASKPINSSGRHECPPSSKTDVLITSSWNEAEKALGEGGKVLFVPLNSDLDWTSPPLDNVPVFWNRFMGPAWGRMLGLFIDKKVTKSKSHALDGFPTSTNFDWQWARVIGNVRAVNLDRLPPELEPIVWAIDDWNRNYKLGVIFECAVGKGRLLVSAINVTKPDDSNPVARQLRQSLLNYMRSDCFQPQVKVSTDQMHSLMFDTRIMNKLGATAQLNGAPENNVIDGDPNTFSIVGDQRRPTREPAKIVISFPAPVAMSGLILMPRQNHREHEGDIREYAVQVSDDGAVWREVLRGELVSTFAPQQLRFANPTTARYLRLDSLSGFGPDKTTALAELAVIYAGPKLKESSEGGIEYQRNKSATPDIDEGPGAADKKAKPKPTP